MRVLEERLPEEGGGNKPGPNPHPALGFPQLGCEKGVSEHRLRSEGAAALTPCPANLPSAAPSGRPRVRTPGARCDQAPGGSGLCHRPTLGSGTAPSPAARLWPISKAVRETQPCYWLIPQLALPPSPASLSAAPLGLAEQLQLCRGYSWSPRSRVWGAAMAGSPGSGASLEGVSLGSSEEADLQREGRERWGGEAARGELAPSSTLLPQGLGIWRGGPGSGPSGT